MNLTINGNLLADYSDIYTPEVLSALSSLAHFNNKIKEEMTARIKRRADRGQQKKKITFLDSQTYIPRTKINVQDAREGKFEGAVIPSDLQRQWIQGTGPASKPNAINRLEKGQVKTQAGGAPSLRSRRRRRITYRM